MNRRLNITLPEQTVKLIDRVVSKGQRSRLIDRAVKRYIEEESRTNLRKQLADSYTANARLDQELAEQWFPLEHEAWRSENR
jgi:CopG family transcriptional regulator / antitoxin EndoAI